MSESGLPKDQFTERLVSEIRAILAQDGDNTRFAAALVLRRRDHASGVTVDMAVGHILWVLEDSSPSDAWCEPCVKILELLVPFARQCSSTALFFTKRGEYGFAARVMRSPRSPQAQRRDLEEMVELTSNGMDCLEERVDLLDSLHAVAPSAFLPLYEGHASAAVVEHSLDNVRVCSAWGLSGAELRVASSASVASEVDSFLTRADESTLRRCCVADRKGRSALVRSLEAAGCVGFLPRVVPLLAQVEALRSKAVWEAASMEQRAEAVLWAVGEAGGALGLAGEVHYVRLSETLALRRAVVDAVVARGGAGTGLVLDERTGAWNEAGEALTVDDEAIKALGQAVQVAFRPVPLAVSDGDPRLTAAGRAAETAGWMPLCLDRVSPELLVATDGSALSTVGDSLAASIDRSSVLRRVPLSKVFHGSRAMLLSEAVVEAKGFEAVASEATTDQLVLEGELTDLGKTLVENLSVTQVLAKHVAKRAFRHDQLAGYDGRWTPLGQLLATSPDIDLQPFVSPSPAASSSPLPMHVVLASCLSSESLAAVDGSLTPAGAFAAGVLRHGEKQSASFSPLVRVLASVAHERLVRADGTATDAGAALVPEAVAAAMAKGRFVRVPTAGLGRLVFQSDSSVLAALESCRVDDLIDAAGARTPLAERALRLPEKRQELLLDAVERLFREHLTPSLIKQFPGVAERVKGDATAIAKQLLEDRRPETGVATDEALAALAHANEAVAQVVADTRGLIGVSELTQAGFKVPVRAVTRRTGSWTIFALISLASVLADIYFAAEFFLIHFGIFESKEGTRPHALPLAIASSSSLLIAFIANLFITRSFIKQAYLECQRLGCSEFADNLLWGENCIVSFIIIASCVASPEAGTLLYSSLAPPGATATLKQWSWPAVLAEDVVHFFIQIFALLYGFTSNFAVYISLFTTITQLAFRAGRSIVLSSIRRSTGNGVTPEGASKHSLNLHGDDGKGAGASASRASTSKLPRSPDDPESVINPLNGAFATSAPSSSSLVATESPLALASQAHRGSILGGDDDEPKGRQPRASQYSRSSSNASRRGSILSTPSRRSRRISTVSGDGGPRRSSTMSSSSPDEESVPGIMKCIDEMMVSAFAGGAGDKFSAQEVMLAALKGTTAYIPDRTLWMLILQSVGLFFVFTILTIAVIVFDPVENKHSKIDYMWPLLVFAVIAVAIRFSAMIAQLRSIQSDRLAMDVLFRSELYGAIIMGVVLGDGTLLDYRSLVYIVPKKVVANSSASDLAPLCLNLTIFVAAGIRSTMSWAALRGFSENKYFMIAGLVGSCIGTIVCMVLLTINLLRIYAAEKTGEAEKEDKLEEVGEGARGGKETKTEDSATAPVASHLAASTSALPETSEIIDLIGAALAACGGPLLLSIYLATPIVIIQGYFMYFVFLYLIAIKLFTLCPTTCSKWVAAWNLRIAYALCTIGPIFPIVGFVQSAFVIIIWLITMITGLILAIFKVPRTIAFTALARGLTITYARMKGCCLPGSFESNETLAWRRRSPTFYAAVTGADVDNTGERKASPPV